MKITTAKKIVSKQGIIWRNYFDLSFVLNNINQQEHKSIAEAIKRLMQYITTGK
jgi:hypothetical protein